MSQQHGLLENDKGEISATRLMCLASLLSATIFGFLTVQNSLKDLETGQSDPSTGFQITIGFLIAAFAPKTVQKFAEKRIG